MDSWSMDRADRQEGAGMIVLFKKKWSGIR